MLNEERRRLIVEILNREGRVLVGALAKHFRTSQVTIRKDIKLEDFVVVELKNAESGLHFPVSQH